MKEDSGVDGDFKCEAGPSKTNRVPDSKEKGLAAAQPQAFVSKVDRGVSRDLVSLSLFHFISRSDSNLWKSRISTDLSANINFHYPLYQRPITLDKDLQGSTEVKHAASQHSIRDSM